jgi:hypothetical protein
MRSSEWGTRKCQPAEHARMPNQPSREGWHAKVPTRTGLKRTEPGERSADQCWEVCGVPALTVCTGTRVWWHVECPQLMRCTERGWPADLG